MKKITIIMLAVLILSLSGCGNEAAVNSNEADQLKEYPKIETVEASVPEFLESELNLVGVVKPGKNVQIKSELNGEIRAVFGEEGDYIEEGQLVAIVSDEQININLENMQTSIADQRAIYSHSQAQLNEAVKQAQIGVDNAYISLDKARRDLQTAMESSGTDVNISQKNIESLEINLQTAEDNLENIKKINETSMESFYNSAAVHFDSSVNNIDTYITSLDNILGIDDEQVNDSFERYLGIKNTEYLKNAEQNYFAAKKQNENLRDLNPKDLPEKSLQQLKNGLNYVDEAVAATIKVLDYSDTGEFFSPEQISALKSSLLRDQQAVVGAISQTQGFLDSIDSAQKQHEQAEASALSAVEAAKKQIELARGQLQSTEIGTDSRVNSAQSAYEMARKQLENAQSALESAKETRKIQLESINAQINSLLGQNDLTDLQKNKLTVESTASGIISKKMVETGDKITAYTALLEISDLNEVKINFDLISDDLKYIEEGDIVYLEDNLEARISKIEPIADPVSRKINVEITFDNRNHELIAETFVNIRIPLKKRNTENLIYLPLRAVEVQQSQNVVRVAEDNKLRIKTVETGDIEGDKIQILSGLDKGEFVIIEGGRFLEEGIQLSETNTEEF